MIRNIESTNITNKFLDHLNKDIESTPSSKNFLVFANKSTNLYKLFCKNNQNLLHKNMTQPYKKAPKNAKHDVDGKKALGNLLQ